MATASATPVASDAAAPALPPADGILPSAATAGAAAAPPPPPAVTEAPAIGARVAGVLASLGDDVRDFWAVTHVPVVDGRTLTPLQFLRDFVKPNQPVVIEGLIDAWPARDAWRRSDDRLLELAGDSTVTVNVTPNGRGDAVLEPSDTSVVGTSSLEAAVFVKPEEVRMPFREFVDELHAGRRDARDSGGAAGSSREPERRRVPYLSWQNDSLRAEMPVLGRDIEVGGLPLSVEAFGNTPDTVNFWMGDERSESTVHKDPYENMYAVLRGAKRFTLLPPTDAAFTYERDFPPAQYTSRDGDPHSFDVVVQEGEAPVPWIPVDVTAPDLTRYPLFRHASPVEVRVPAGCVLYLPSLWLHHVRQEGVTVAVNFMHDMSFGANWAFLQLAHAVRTLAVEAGVANEVAVRGLLDKAAAGAVAGADGRGAGGKERAGAAGRD